jgi:hypothetical protein
MTNIISIFSSCAANHSLHNITEFGICADFMMNSPHDAKLEVLIALLMTVFVF